MSRINNSKWIARYSSRLALSHLWSRLCAFLSNRLFWTFSYLLHASEWAALLFFPGPFPPFFSFSSPLFIPSLLFISACPMRPHRQLDSLHLFPPSHFSSRPFQFFCFFFFPFKGDALGSCSSHSCSLSLQGWRREWKGAALKDTDEREKKKQINKQMPWVK